MRKTILTIILCGIVVLAITGCGEKKKENANPENYIIVDKTQEQTELSCNDVLEKFYTDANYSYYWNCGKDNYVVVRYKDGKEITVSDSLKNNTITISDLDRFNINYIKEKIS